MWQAIAWTIADWLPNANSKLFSKLKHFYSGKYIWCIWFCRLHNVGHFLQASIFCHEKHCVTCRETDNTPTLIQVPLLHTPRNNNNDIFWTNAYNMNAFWATFDTYVNVLCIAVVVWAKLWLDWIIRIKITAKRIVVKFQLWAPIVCGGGSLITKSHGWPWHLGYGEGWYSSMNRPS